MVDKKKTEAPMAAATEPTTANRTGTWRFEKPVFVEQIAPCSEACPVGEDIPAIMALDESGAFEEAYQRILLENPFPGICGRLCFHPCEKVCNRRRFDQAVSIRDLEYFVSKTARESKFEIDKPKKMRAAKAAVFGSGPAGLSCAYFLARSGYRTTILEMNSQLRIYKLLHSEPKVSLTQLEWEIGQLLSLDIDLRLNVGSQHGIDPDLANEFDAIYIPSESWQICRSLLKESNDKSQTNRVILSTGANRSQTIMLARFRESNTKFVYPDVTGIKTDIDPPQKDGNLSKSFIREIASGKFAAMVIGLSLDAVDLKSVHQFVLGRLGALSMENYLQKGDSNTTHKTGHVVRFSDLNTASFQKSNRIQPSQPDLFYSKRQAARSARRCFKCGVCTFCYKCYNYCPDLSIYMDAKEKYRELDYSHCKGCGICATECPRAAIDWVKE